MASYLREWVAPIQTTFTVLMLAVAVYADKLKMYEIPGDACGTTITTGDQWKVVSKMQDGTYLPGTDCSITFKAPDGYERFFLRITHFNIQYVKRCAKDKLVMWNVAGEKKTMIGETDFGLCGETKSLPNYYYAKNNTVTVQFVTDGANDKNYTGFKLLITPMIGYKEATYETTDGSEGVEYCNGYRCLTTKKCIPKDAFCNKENQCEDASDEPDGCQYGDAPKSAIVSGFLIHTVWLLAWKLTRLITDGNSAL